jgi:predicted DNA-binding transcriptional regulator YafY
MAQKISLDYWKELFRMNNLIDRKSTGNPDRFVQKMEISRSVLYRRIDDLKALNAPIEYDNSRQTYFYSEPFSLLEELKKHCR